MYTISAWLGDWHQDFDEKLNVFLYFAAPVSGCYWPYGLASVVETERVPRDLAGHHTLACGSIRLNVL
jgi:hypothetical protein